MRRRWGRPRRAVRRGRRWARCCLRRGLTERWLSALGALPHTLGVIGEEFASVLLRAQQGDEDAFSLLWRDVNPALVRYLQVMTQGVRGRCLRDVGVGGRGPSALPR